MVNYDKVLLQQKSRFVTEEFKEKIMMVSAYTLTD